MSPLRRSTALPQVVPNTLEVPRRNLELPAPRGFASSAFLLRCLPVAIAPGAFAFSLVPVPRCFRVVLHLEAQTRFGMRIAFTATEKLA
jgi:hypothetical protein